MSKTNLRLALWSLTAAAALTWTTAAGAQWSGSIYGAAEYDTNNSNMLFAGMSMSPAGSGVVPTLGLQGYRLSYESGSARTTVYQIKPAVGFRAPFSVGSVNANIGYAFTDKELPGVAVGTSTDQGEGVVLAGGINLRPSSARIEWEGLGSYNFGSESFWGRAQASRPIRQTPTGAWHVAPQLSFLNGQGYSAIQPALMLNWRANQGMSWGAGVGYSIPNAGDNAVVFKLTAGTSLF